MTSAQLQFGFGSITTPCSATTNRIRWRTPAIVNPLPGGASNPSRPNRLDVGEGDARMKVFEVLKSELLNDPVFEWTPYSRQWVDHMIDYNVPRGKLLRGGTLIECYKSLKPDPTEDELFLARVLGWCMEMLHSAFLMQDDIMDNSEMRRGQPSWYRVPKVGNIAINDGLLLLYQVPRILKKHFGQKPYYLDLVDVFNEVELQTVLGEMLDLISTVEGERDLLKYSWELYNRIAKYKSSCYSFYLPVACALLLAGENLADHVNVKDLLCDIGIYFTILDDYQDCFGDPKKSGKIGTDIADFKCSWLVLKAMELCNEEQKKILLKHYGKPNPEDVAKVKGVYNNVGIQGIRNTHLKKSYDDLQLRAEAHPSKAVQTIWASYTPFANQWL